MNHTTACGYDPIDRNYGIGFKPGDTNYSPFSRVNRLRDHALNDQVRLDSQRAVYVTEALKKYESAPLDIRWARALENCLLNFDLHYYEDELIMGDLGGGNQVAEVYQEFAFEWMCRELKEKPLYEREFSPLYYDDQVRDELLSCEEYWKGKTVDECIRARLTPEEVKGSNMGMMLYFLNLYQYYGVGHCTPDIPSILNLGFKGLKEKVRSRMENLDITTAEGIRRRDFHNAQLIVLEAASAYCRRYAAFAREKAEEIEDEARRKEVLRMGVNCEHIAEEPPRDIWEALQLFHMVHQMILMESNGHSVSFGRVDQYLYPFYKKDVENGTFTKEFIQELLEAFWIKSQTMVKVREGQTGAVNRSGDRGWGGIAMIFGGMDRQGNDATNDLTFMFLDCVAHVRLPSPWPTVRMHKGTPKELKIKVAQIIRAGFGHPKLFNDEVAIEASLRKGIPLEDARDYAHVGCVEIDQPGCEYGWHDAAYFSVAKVLELSLNNGRCCNCSEKCPRYKVCAGAGSQLGIPSGSLKEFKTFEDLKASYRKQLKYWVDRMVTSIETMDLVHQERKALPFLSCFINDCTEKGLDVSRGGARYNGTGPQCNGCGTAADGLSVMKQFIFDEKKVTGEELLEALKHNWEGYEPLYRLVNSEKAHHYGNDDDRADEMARYIFDSYCEELETRTNSRGGKYLPGVYSVSSNVVFGLVLGATPDGRKAGEAISDNLGPVHTRVSSHDHSGPTALANSIGKLDHARATNGTLINMKFTTEALSGETGLENFINYIDGYMRAGALHIQVMITDSRVLREAQKEPEKYNDLLVRVSGYSAFFVQLGENLQNDLIGRSEHSFE